MNRLRRLILAICLVSAILYSCDNSDDRSSVYLNVKNETSITLESVTIYLGGVVHNFGAVNSGQTSDEFLFNDTYVADSITFKYGLDLTILKPNNALFQWMGMEVGATYRYSIQLDQNNQPKYSVSKVD
ncbi:hypothetical protein [Roseivirga sp.]|uniref:hypothetical protein n=1 Tax=Roseivirga sp. TaxID=1964215 RepID=UPI002B2785A9|nr:hypothetical protein [Roseivirga sp.]